MAIAVAISFDSGVLLYADAKYREPCRIPIQFTKMFSTACGANHRGRSIFLVPEPNDRTVEAVHDAERMLRLIDPAGCTIELEDDEFLASGRGALYYARAIEEPKPLVNGVGIRVENGEVRMCPGPAGAADDCLADAAPRAWSSPVWVDRVE